MSARATIALPSTLTERTTAADLLAVEDAAYDTLVSDTPLGDEAAAAIWEACQRTGTRDPLITRILQTHPSLRTRALDRLSTILTRLDAPDPEMLTLAGTLTWATEGDPRHARLLLALAVETGTRYALAHLVSDAISTGLPPETWLTVTEHLTLDDMRANPSAPNVA